MCFYFAYIFFLMIICMMIYIFEYYNYYLYCITAVLVVVAGYRSSSPGRASGLSVSTIPYETDSKYYQGVNITWQLPQDRKIIILFHNLFYL